VQVKLRAGEQGSLLADWTQAEATMSKDDFYDFALDWNRQMINNVRSTYLVGLCF
jgi:hypothetical protein